MVSLPTAEKQTYITVHMPATAVIKDNEIPAFCFFFNTIVSSSFTCTKSTKSINEDVEHGASLAVEAGIIVKEPIAKKAIPNCNITYIDGEEMKQALSGYLKVLFEQDASSVGGALPADDFYYIP